MIFCRATGKNNVKLLSHWQWKIFFIASGIDIA